MMVVVQRKNCPRNCAETNVISLRSAGPPDFPQPVVVGEGTRHHSSTTTPNG